MVKLKKKIIIFIQTMKGKLLSGPRPNYIRGPYTIFLQVILVNDERVLDIFVFQ